MKNPNKYWLIKKTTPIAIAILPRSKLGVKNSEVLCTNAVRIFNKPTINKAMAKEILNTRLMTPTLVIAKTIVKTPPTKSKMP